jgi:hypothetical protein
VSSVVSRSELCNVLAINPKSKIQNPKSALCLCASVAFLLCSCQTERVSSSDGRPLPPAPLPAQPVPAGTKADRMVFMVGSKPDDTNGNGYPDSVKATVALFSLQHPTSIRQDGAFVFTMYSPGQSTTPEIKPLGLWRIEGDTLNKTMDLAQYGPFYRFQLSLLDVGDDRLPLERADLVCRFEPSDGSTPVKCDGVRTIQIGRRAATIAGR